VRWANVWGVAVGWGDAVGWETAAGWASTPVAIAQSAAAAPPEGFSVRDPWYAVVYRWIVLRFPGVVEGLCIPGLECVPVATSLFSLSAGHGHVIVM
jgi:hypothetical protein